MLCHWHSRFRRASISAVSARNRSRRAAGTAPVRRTARASAREALSFDELEAGDRRLEQVEEELDQALEPRLVAALGLDDAALESLVKDTTLTAEIDALRNLECQ